MIMSWSSVVRLEEDIVAAASRTWFQAYLSGGPDRIAALVTASPMPVKPRVEALLLLSMRKQKRSGL